MLKKALVILLFAVLCCNGFAQEVAVFPQTGHNNFICSVAFSPDGKRIASGSSDSTIKLWDVDTGRVIRTFSGHLFQVLTVAFSPDGKQIVSGSLDTSVKLWDAATGNEIRTFTDSLWKQAGEEKRWFPWSIAFSPDGKQIVAGCTDGNIKIFEVATGREIKSFIGNSGLIFSVAYNHDGKQVVSCSANRTVRLWDVDTGREIRNFSGHSDLVYSVAFSPDGKQIVSGSRDMTIKLWDTATGREIKTFSGHSGYVFSIAFSPDGKHIVSGSEDKLVKLWDIATGSEIRTLSNEYSVSYNTVAFSPDGGQIASVAQDNTIKLWDTATGNEIRTFSGYSDMISTVESGTDGKSFYYFNADRIMKHRDVVSGILYKETRTLYGHSEIASFGFILDGEQIISRSEDGKMKLWDVATGREIRTFSGNFEKINTYEVSPDEKQIVSVSDDTTIKLWDIATGREIRTFSGNSEKIKSIKFSPDGKQIASGSVDGNIKLWDVATGREIRTLSGHFAQIYSIAFSADGKHIISGSEDSHIRMWEVDTGNSIRDFSWHGSYLSKTLKHNLTDTGEETTFYFGQVLSVDFSPDGKHIISGSNDNTIKLWNVETGNEEKVFTGHTNKVHSVAFISDGKQILSGSADGTVRLWDIATGRETAQFISFTDGEWIVITPDGYYNSSPNGDQYLNVRVGNNVYGIDQYRSAFYRPHIVTARLQGKPDPVRITDNIQDAASFVPPEVVFQSPEKNANVTSRQIELSFTVIDQNQPIKNVSIEVNGRRIGGDALKVISGMRGVKLEATEIRLTENKNRLEFRLPLTLDPGTNRIEVIANNPYSEGRRSIDVNYQAASQQDKPNLWILSVGINRYDSHLLRDLDYAVNDAQEMVNVFKAQEGKRYGKVNALIIADNAAIKPTRANIVNGFNHLQKASPLDTVVLFIAGHGLNDDAGNYFVIPSDAQFDANNKLIASEAIPYGQLQMVLTVPGRKLIFIDTCHSDGVAGSEGEIKMLRALKEVAFVFTATGNNESSLEYSDLQHGVFTYYLIEGIKGKADPYNTGTVTMSALYTYLSEEVPKKTKDAQQPKLFTPSGFVDYLPIADLK